MKNLLKHQKVSKYYGSGCSNSEGTKGKELWGKKNYKKLMKN